MKPPVVCGKVNRASANLPAINDGGLQRGLFFLGRAKGIWLTLVVISDRPLAHIFQLVVLEVLLLHVRALFEHYDTKSGRG